MIINFSEVIEFKKAFSKDFSNILHFHDNCAGQYFTTEEILDNTMKDFITCYFTEKKCVVIFSDDDMGFRLN
ncbi:MAG: hypothetical protein IIX45_05120 [Lachnospiraceae bacterium]|nr:hypothetical protein [Lachnospiraceae bacterium]